MALVTIAGHLMDDSKWDMYCLLHKHGTAAADEILCGVSFADLELVTADDVNKVGIAHVSSVTLNEINEILQMKEKRNAYRQACLNAIKGDAR